MSGRYDRGRYRRSGPRRSHDTRPWVVVAVSPAGVGGLVDPDKDVDIGVEVFEVVQFIKMGPGIGEALGSGVGLVDDKEPGFLLFGVRLK